MCYFNCASYGSSFGPSTVHATRSPADWSEGAYAYAIKRAMTCNYAERSAMTPDRASHRTRLAAGNEPSTLRQTQCAAASRSAWATPLEATWPAASTKNASATAQVDRAGGHDM